MSTTTNGVIFISNARISFPNIVEPQRQTNEQTGKERISWNCELLLKPDHPALKQFMARYGELALEKFKELAPQVMAMIQAERRLRCFGHGEEKLNKKTMVPYLGYPGHIYITCGRDTPPQMIQPDGSAVDPQNTMAYQAIARTMYGGCRVNAAVRQWIQNNAYGRAIRCDLVALQFAADDTPFGEGVVDASGMFAPVAAQAAPAAMPAMPSFLPPFMQ